LWGCFGSDETSLKDLKQLVCDGIFIFGFSIFEKKLGIFLGNCGIVVEASECLFT
jgi:hypothetical protein